MSKHLKIDWNKDLSQSPKIMWWGYLHSNGQPQLKRWFGDHKDYTEDCYGNDFVVEVVPPFESETREGAWAYLISQLHLPPVKL